MVQRDDFELAAALLAMLGEPVPHDPKLEPTASILRQRLPDDRSALLKAAELCGEPNTPGHLYLCTKIFSWLGRQFDADTVKCAEAYLAAPGWDALPKGKTLERGIEIDLETQTRAGIFADLGSAYAGLGKYEKACSAYGKAFELEPYRIEYAIEFSNALMLFGRGEEALQFLQRQKKSPYCRTVKYRGVTGQICYNSSFRDTLDSQITGIKKRLENRKDNTGRSR